MFFVNEIRHLIGGHTKTSCLVTRKNATRLRRQILGLVTLLASPLPLCYGAETTY